MVFLDYRNIVSNTELRSEAGASDLCRLVRARVGSRELVGAYLFKGMSHILVEGDPTDSEHRAPGDGFPRGREGLLVRREGRVEQKEVDVAMACEMLKHALLDHYDVVVIVSGDRDFVPAIQEVQAEGSWWR